MFTDYAWMADMQVLYILGLPFFAACYFALRWARENDRKRNSKKK